MQSEAQTQNDANNDADEPVAAAAPLDDAPAPEGTKKDQRERSTIEFPYQNLEEVEEGAKQLYRAAGMGLISQAQAASAMDQSALSSTFRVRLSAMRIFGVIETEGGKVRLTPLGRSLAEAHSALQARVKAFMQVELYRAVVKEHEGHTLPGVKALENEFGELGVAKKQADRARQVFDRSARHAGFIKQGSDRFVTPILQSGQAQEKPVEAEQDGDTPAEAGQPMKKVGTGDGGGKKLDPVISALVEKLPPPGSPWGVDDQVVWLRMMAMAFTMAYGGRQTIKIVDPDDGASRP